MSKDLVTVEAQSIDYVPSFAIKIDEAKRRLDQLQSFVNDLMKQDEDYGIIPGTEKPTLLKPGAEKLCNIFALASRFTEVRHIEDWGEGLFYYVYNCQLIDKRTGHVETDCTASANSKEERYRYRYEERTCPKCGQPTVIKGKEQYGGGWLCWAKKGGCGAKFKDGDEAIEGQVVGRVENPEPYTLVNTLQKMAQKRALVGATLTAVRASGIFTQDIEDMDIATLNGEPEAKPAKKAKKAKGKKSDDPVTVFWSFVEEKHIDKKTAQAFVERAGGDFEEALAQLQQRIDFDEVSNDVDDTREIPF